MYIDFSGTRSIIIWKFYTCSFVVLGHIYLIKVELALEKAVYKFLTIWHLNSVKVNVYSNK